MIEILKNNESDEFLGYFPHLKEVYQKKKLTYDKIIEDVEKSIKEIEKKNPENLSKYIFQNYSNIGGILKRYFDEEKKISIQKILKDFEGKKLNYLFEKYEK